jgi:hypothetical protein
MKWKTAVVIGKRMLVQEEKNQWRWGEIASTIEPKYGEATLEKYAEEVGINYTTLRNCEATWQAWKEFALRRAISFSAARELNSHPKRFEIAKKNLKLTFNQAREIMQRYRDRPKPESKPIPSKNGNEKVKSLAQKQEEKQTKKIDAQLKGPCMRFLARTDRSQTLIEECEFLLDTFKQNLNVDQLHTMAEGCIRTGNEWIKLADEIRRKNTGRKRANLTVVK